MTRQEHNATVFLERAKMMTRHAEIIQRHAAQLAQLIRRLEFEVANLRTESKTNWDRASWMSDDYPRALVEADFSADYWRKVFEGEESAA